MFLRRLAERLDGRVFVCEVWHKSSVKSMNRYVYRTEMFINALCEHVPAETAEKIRKQFGASNAPQVFLDKLREEFGPIDRHMTARPRPAAE